MTIQHDDDTKTLHGMGYAQELSRRMRGFSNFAISFSIICILAGGITSYPLAMATGGGFSAVIGWAIGGFFALVVATALGQIASAYPTAGALYHWSSILGGRGWGWATAWINLLGLVFVAASVNVGVYLLFKGLVAGPLLGIDTSGWDYWHQTFIVAGITVTQAMFNHFGIRITTALTDFSGYLIFIVAIILTGTFLYWGHGFDFSRLTQFVNNTGEAGGGYVPEARPALIAFLIGLLYPLYTITGFDASAHTSEETKDARRTVPRGMIHSVFWSLAFGLVMAMSFVMASPDPAATARDGGNAWFNLYENLPAPFWLKTALACGIVLANYLCALASITSTSRMIYAFARDGGLPGSKLWRQVSPKFRTPVPAIWLTAVLAVAATLYSPAFAALAAGCALFLYISYAMPVAAGLLAEGKTWTEFGPFRLGRWSKPMSIVVLIGVIVVAYAGIQPPFDILINYAIGIIVLLFVLWFGLERKRFKGPPIGAEIRQRQQDILQAEAVLAN
jgi:amino acid transporter